MKKHLVITVDINKKTCGRCEFAQVVHSNPSWWRCDLFEGAWLGNTDTQKRPSRAQACLQAEADLVYFKLGPPSAGRKVRVRDSCHEQ